jgi:hyperosmotically inducible periplasmic protein
MGKAHDKEVDLLAESKNYKATAIVVAAFSALLILGACNNNAQHPDVKDAVNTAMTRHDLGVVKVSQDRDKGVLTLSGDVETPDKKSEAESVAKEAAPGYTIANEIGVRPIGEESQAKAVDSNLDDGIENNYKAAIKAHKDLDDQSIHYDAQNGTLVLKGSVKTVAQKKEAALLAKNTPNVKDVIDEIEVNPKKHSTAD